MTTAALYTKATKIESKIPDITNLATKAALNSKAKEVESKIPGITNLATTAALKSKATYVGKKILLERKYLILLIWVEKLLSIPRPQKLKKP